MDSDLRTDACPSPPRDDPDAILRDKPGNKKTDNTEYENIDEGKTHNVPKFPFAGKHKSNFRKATKTKCDKVIYINNSADVHIGPSMTYTVNVGSPQPKETPIIYHQTQKIKRLLASTDAVNREHLIFLSGHISATSWKFVARKLGFSDGRIQHFYADHHATGMKEVIYQCLLEWIQSKPDDATIGRITDVLWSCEEREAVDLFSHFMYSDE
ncbi:protein immune deficiency [Atheta coriaria]|uniref:protein immune deficiency n=1 Tax=Dalotia coriaria TaxID=877792 RepID=UPI0031F35C61